MYLAGRGTGVTKRAAQGAVVLGAWPGSYIRTVLSSGGVLP